MKILALLLLSGLALAGIEDSLYVVKVTTERTSVSGVVRQSLAAPALPVGPDGVLLVVGFALSPPDRDEPVRVTARRPDGTEVSARVLAAFDDLDCTVLKLAAGPMPKPVALDAVPLRVGTNVTLYSRHGEVLGWAPRTLSAKINAVHGSYYGLDRDTTHWLGSVVVANGKVVGFVAARPTLPDDSGMMLGVGTKTFLVASADMFASAANAAGAGPKGRAWLGVNLAPFTEDREAFFSVGSDWRGALVTGVSAGSPAAKAGIKVHDLLQSLGSYSFHFERQEDWGAMLRGVQRLELYRKLKCRVVRFTRQPDGEYSAQPMELVMTLTERPIDFADAPETEVKDLGLMVKPLTLDRRRALQVRAGQTGVVVTRTARASPARLARLMSDDLVMKVGEQDVVDVTTFLALVDQARREKKKKVIFFVRRGNRTLFVPLNTNW